MKIAVSILLACSVMFSYAQKRVESEMRNIAKNHFLRNKEGDFCEEKLSEKTFDFGRLYRYVDIDQTAHNGFVIVSENRKSPQILAFGDGIDFPTESLPEHIRLWLSGYARLTATDESSETVEEWLDVSQLYVNTVAPLLGSISWGQENPYYLDCPQINGEYAPTGCVATAVAQIMKYFRWPETVIDWDHIYDAYAPVEISADSYEYATNSASASVRTLYISPLYSGARACVAVENLISLGSSSFSGEYALLLFDENNNFVQRVSEKESVEKTSSAQIVQCDYIYPSISSSLSDGNYIIRCGIRNGSFGSWNLAVKSTAGDTYKDSIHVCKVGAYVYTNGNKYPCSLTREKISPLSTLLRDVGTSLNMKYALAGSGAYSTDVPKALSTYFNYDADMFVANPDCFTDEQWHRLLQQELAAGRPVYYSGNGSQSEGHAFVIDGVMEQDGLVYYHVNWGWDGLCNGYYLLNLLRPSATGTGGEQGANYSNQAQMVVGIQLEDGVVNTQLTCKGYTTYETNLFPGEATSTSLEGLSVCALRDVSGVLSIQLRNRETNDTITVYKEQRTVRAGSAGNTQYLRVRIPQNIAAGTYNLLLSFETQDGVVLGFRNQDWPLMEVRDLSDWFGGEQTTAKQSLAVSSVQYDWSTAEIGRLGVVCDSLLNIFPEAMSGYLSLLVCNMDGRLLSNLSESTAFLIGGDAVLKNTRINGTFSRNIPDGEYLLKIGFRETGSNQWTYVRKLEHADKIGWAGFEDFSIPFIMRNGLLFMDDAEMNGSDMPWVESGLDFVQEETKADGSIYNLGGAMLLHKGAEGEAQNLPNGIYVVGKKKIHIRKR